MRAFSNSTAMDQAHEANPLATQAIDHRRSIVHIYSGDNDQADRSNDMGLFAPFVYLRCDSTADDLGRSVRDLLQARNVAEARDPAAAERLLLIAPAGDGWLMVVDHVEQLSAAIPDADGLLAQLAILPAELQLMLWLPIATN